MKSSARSQPLGDAVERFAIGDRVGVPWLGWTCGECEFCRSGRENLCAHARFTGYQIDGGYAEFTVPINVSVSPFQKATATSTQHRCYAPA